MCDSQVVVFLSFSFLCFGHPRQVLTDLPVGGQSGYLSDNSTGVHTFYWLFEARGVSSANDVPLVIWLQGGPGCSSLLGLFAENGPYHVDHNLSLSANPFSWTSVAHMLYIDQPVGTGFSYCDESSQSPSCIGALDSDTVASDMVTALELFYSAYPHLATTDLYIAGESYAGHMIPPIATRIVSRNADGVDGAPIIPLKGISMGDGWTMPLIQNGAWAEYGYSTGLLDGTERDAVTQQYEKCSALIKAQRWEESLKYCYQNLLDVVTHFAGNVSVYDIRRYSSPTFSSLTRFLNQEHVQRALGVHPTREWLPCVPDGPAKRLRGEFSQSVAHLIPPLLDFAGIRVLVYSGQYDLIVNLIGTERWVSAMAWSGQTAWQSAPRHAWRAGAQSPALDGYVKRVGLLTHAVVVGAGHMVPMDQPRAALNMLARWIDGSLPQ